MSSILIAIAGSVGAVALVIVIIVKLYRRYKRNKKREAVPPPTLHPYPIMAPFPTFPPPPPLNPFGTNQVIFQPQSPHRCMHCGFAPPSQQQFYTSGAPINQQQFYTPGDTPIRSLDKRPQSYELHELSRN
jgi:hypothetical protein